LRLNYEAIIFDVSDTLVEYSPNYAQIYGDRLRGLGFEISAEKAKEISRAVNSAIGEQTQKEQCGEPRISEEAYNTLLDKAALLCTIDENICTKKHLIDLSKIDIPKQEMSIIHNVINVLTVLKTKYRLAIVSNHHSWLMDYLHKCGLAPYFESIVISDIVGVAKPNIRIMQIALEELDLNAENCLYVGDQPLDVLCSKQVGMDCAWIVTDEIELPKSIPYKEDYRIDKLSDLLGILQIDQNKQKDPTDTVA
jgi:HAD superfamily hydrolase (TIGR01549 family)